MKYLDDYDEIMKLIKMGEANRDRARKDLDYARKQAKLAFEEELKLISQPDRIRKELKKLHNVWHSLSKETHEYLDNISITFGEMWSSDSPSVLPIGF